MRSKEEIRREMKKKRNALSGEQITQCSDAVFLTLTGRDCYKEAQEIYCYMTSGSEVDTAGFLERALLDGKKVALPRVEGERIKFYYIKGLDRLKRGSFGILEPEEGEEARSDRALVILPGLAFDRRGGRIGYGGGYYDRYLEGKEPYRAAVCYDFQIVEEIPRSSHDIGMDEIITPTEVIGRIERR